jgi:hypothetical protein
MDTYTDKFALIVFRFLSYYMKEKEWRGWKMEWRLFGSMEGIIK